MPRRLILAGLGDLVFEHYEDEVVGPREVLLESVWSGVSAGTELQIYKGTAPRFGNRWDPESRLLIPRNASDALFPVELGYETVARVVSIGEGVTGFSLGDIFWLDAPHRETHKISVDQPPPHRKFSVGIDPRHAVFYPLTRVALGAVHDAAPLVGDSVAVYGAGTVGLLCAQIYKRAGVREVFVVDSNDERLLLAANMGMTTINSETTDPVRSIKQECGGTDSVIEATGTYSALERALKTATVGGKVVAVSSYGNQTAGLTLGHEFHRNRITLQSSMTINDCPHPNAPRWNLERLNEEAALLIEKGNLQLEELAKNEFRFSEARDVYRLLAETKSAPAKILFNYAAN
jgi:threonine dehydrogenase-like Zn-dependent dehydrogenase